MSNYEKRGKRTWKIGFATDELMLHDVEDGQAWHEKLPKGVS
jgi:hypothetical protein